MLSGFEFSSEFQSRINVEDMLNILSSRVHVDKNSYQIGAFRLVDYLFNVLRVVLRSQRTLTQSPLNMHPTSYEFQRFLFYLLFCFMTWIIAKVTESLTGRKINIYESQQMNTYCSKSTTLYQPNLVSMYRKFEHKLKLISRHQNTMQNCRLFVGL